ncbi:MAG: exosome complex exonuclease Rrp41 [Candidatus Aenigmarchaeota archaeon]|nr:exosome complex exonuclease Rrp41 [Candidatus Aenigmarchaeota archaeon]
MSKIGAPEKLIVNGKRLDGRELKDFRPIVLESGNLKRALGSGLFNFGSTHAIAAVYGPRNLHPKWMQDPSRAVLRCTYTMAPFSTTERSRPGHSRRSTEISKVVKEALSQVIFFEEFPKAVIDIFIEIVQANASTRCAGLNAAAIALADAGIPMRDLVSCCSVGKIDGKIALDMAGLEDNFGDVDIAVATVGGTDKVVLLQLDGILSKEEFFEAIDLAVDGCAKINDMQKKVLVEKYRGEEK